MAHISTGVEYALHCLNYLVDPFNEAGQASARDLAELQGVPVDFVAKLFTKLQKSGLVIASEGARGGFRLAKEPDAISVLDVIIAIDGEKPLFECREIRGRCAVFGLRPPAWATRGVCSIHAIMLEAESRMRDALASRTLGDVVATVSSKAPADFGQAVSRWLANEASASRRSRSTVSVKAKTVRRGRRDSSC